MVNKIAKVIPNTQYGYWLSNNMLKWFGFSDNSSAWCFSTAEELVTIILASKVVDEFIAHRILDDDLIVTEI